MSRGCSSLKLGSGSCPLSTTEEKVEGQRKPPGDEGD